MSTNRKSEGVWWKAPPKGANGEKLCRRCLAPIPKGRRRTFCSAECVHEFKIRTDPNYVRLKVFERDKGICALCGADTMALAHRPRARGTGHLWQADHVVPVVEGGGECGLENYRTLCTACHKAETAKLRKRMSRARVKLPADAGQHQAALPF